MRVLICPDKFKGTLSAAAVAEAIAAGWRRARPHDTLELLPMSDGGDGFGSVVGRLLRADVQSVATMDAAHQPCQAQWWWVPRTRTAIIESAQAIGLARLPAGVFHPFTMDTFGLGKLFQAATRCRARRCLVGIGGSATNDGGFGLARAVGWKFLTASGRPIEQWTHLLDLDKVVPPPGGTFPGKILVAVDVNNPLLGPRGATRIYGPQKGLTPADFPLAEANLRRLRQVIIRQLGHDYSRQPGAGAAGGLGFGLRCFLNAELQPGFALFSHHAQLERRIVSFDLVIAGEGAIDASTVMGKGVGELARLCRRHHIPCWGLAGQVKQRNRIGRRFTRLHALVPDLTQLTQASRDGALWLAKLAELSARESEHSLRIGI